jgi:hypothetical protein
MSERVHAASVPRVPSGSNQLVGIARREGGAVAHRPQDAIQVGTSRPVTSRAGNGLRRSLTTVSAAALAIGATLAFVTTSPALATSDSVGVARLQLTSLAPSATEVSYTATFVATDGLTEGSSTIQLSAPAGTVFPGSGYTCDQDYVYDYTTNTGSNCGTITTSNSGATLTYEEGNIDIEAGDLVGIVADGVTNPGTSGALQLSTSSDPTAVSLAMTLSSSGTIGTPNYQQSSYADSATPVKDTASFIATDGLTEGFSTVTLAAPAGTVFPGSGDTCNVDFVYDNTTDTSSNCGVITVSNSGATLTFAEASVDVRPGDEITVVATGVKNAATSGTLNISTSSDPTAQSVPTDFWTASPASLQLGSYAPSSTANTYQVNFTTIHGLTEGSTITLSAPSGTDFVSTPSCTLVFDDTTDAAICQPVSGTGTDTIEITATPAEASSEVTVIVPDVTNDSSTSSQNLAVSDTADGSVATLPYTLSSSGKVSDESLELNTLSSGAKGATYQSSFVATDGLNADGSTITLAAPTGTSFGTASCEYYIGDVTTGSIVCATATTSNSGATVTINVPVTVDANDVVLVTALGVKNDTATTAQSVALSTTSDKSAQSLAYTLVKARPVTGASLQLSSYAKSAKDVTYGVSFQAVDGLTQNYSTITLSAATGTVFDGSGYMCNVVYVYDLTNNSSSNCVTVTSSKAGAKISFPVPVRVGSGDQVRVVADGVTNSSNATGTLSLSTSSDTKAVKLSYTLR